MAISRLDLEEFAPKAMLFGANHFEYFIKKSKHCRINRAFVEGYGQIRSELIVPEPNRFLADRDVVPGQAILDISNAAIEAAVAPMAILDKATLLVSTV